MGAGRARVADDVVEFRKCDAHIEVVHEFFCLGGIPRGDAVEQVGNRDEEALPGQLVGDQKEPREPTEVVVYQHDQRSPWHSHVDGYAWR